MDAPRIKDEYLRDLGLILIGAALSKTKTERQRILDAVPQLTLLQEVDKLLQAIRLGDPTHLAEWLAARSAKIEKGKDVIQAVIDAIHLERRRQKVREVLSQLNNASRLMDPVTLAGKLRECAEQLDGLEVTSGKD